MSEDFERQLNELRKLPLPERMQAINELQKKLDADAKEEAVRTQVHSNLVVTSLIFFCASLHPQNFAKAVNSARESVAKETDFPDELLPALDESRNKLIAFAEKLFLVQQQRKEEENG